MARKNARPTIEASKVFGSQVRATRNRRHWTQQDLVDHLTALDLQIDRSVVARIENGTRGVSLDEALAFAVALGVPPSSLVVPRGDEVDIRIAPNLSLKSWEALLWWRGQSMPLRGQVSDEDGRFFSDAQTDVEVSSEQALPGLARLRNDAANCILPAAALAGHSLVHTTGTGAVVDGTDSPAIAATVLRHMLRSIQRRTKRLLDELEDMSPEGN